MGWKKQLFLISLLEIGVSQIYLLLICPYLCRILGIAEPSWGVAALIIGSGMALSCLLTYLFSTWIRKAEVEEHVKRIPIVYYFGFSMLICLIYFVTMFCLEHFGNMPASTILLLELSFALTASHLFLNRNIVAPSNEQYDSFDEE